MAPPKRNPRFREIVLSWFYEATEEEVKWVFSSLAQKNYRLLEKHQLVLEKVLNNYKSLDGIEEEDQATVGPNSENTFRGFEDSAYPSKGREPQFGFPNHHSAHVDIDGIIERIEECDNPMDGKEPSVLAREAADFEVANSTPPIVQFSAPMYFCKNDDEKFISLDVIRIGNLSAKSEITFKTNSGTAKAGEKFVATSGKITFLAGSNNEELKIDLLQTDVFDTTTEFQVELEKDPAPINCIAGRYLYLTRVKVIDGNCFPSNKFKEHISKGKNVESIGNQVESISFWVLVWEYCKFNMQNKVTKRGTIKAILVDVCKSLYVLLKLLCNLFLVDKVLDKKPDDYYFLLILLALLILLPMIPLHYLDFRKTTWKVGGSSRTKLQSFLLRKFLNYEQSVRINLSSADLIMAVTQDVTEVVHEGYMNFLALLAAMMNLLAVLLFQVIVPTLPIFDVKPKPLGFVVLVLFPAVLLTILYFRHNITTKYISRKNVEEVEVVAQAERTMTNYPLIADFGQRPFFEARFEAKVAKYNKARVDADQVMLNNKYCSPWLTVLCLSLYTVYGGYQVVEGLGGMTLGLFLANVSIMSTIGSSTGLIYQLLMEIESIAPALYKITKFINLPTDVPLRKSLNRDKRARTAAYRKEMSKTVDRGWPADNLPIEMRDLNFSYDPNRGPVFSMRGTVRFNQGELTAMVGPEGEGKSTLLYMLGGVVLPEPGQLFVPSHLRILHVAAQNLFFKASLFENLTFGCLGADDPDASVQRVHSICMRLGFPKDILNLVEQHREGPVLAWGEVIANSHKSLLQFARAVITNPEFMCIHKPVMTYTDAKGDVVLDILREFCEQKGIQQDDKTRHLRRPRTCVITAAKVAAVRKADRIYLVSRKAGIRYVPKELAAGVPVGGISEAPSPIRSQASQVPSLAPFTPRAVQENDVVVGTASTHV